MRCALIRGGENGIHHSLTFYRIWTRWTYCRRDRFLASVLSQLESGLPDYGWSGAFESTGSAVMPAACLTEQERVSDEDGCKRTVERVDWLFGATMYR
jgi:hypothetical protein